MEIVQALDTVQWKDFVDRHPHGCIFHTPEMFNVFARAKGHRPQLWAVLDGGEICALLVPVQITLSPLLRALTTRAISYGSLLCNNNAQGARGARYLLEAYTDQLERGVLFSEFRNLYDQRSLRPIYHNCGFSYEEHLNYLIDLTGSPEKVFQRIGDRTQKNIRRALRKGDVTITDISDRAGATVCYDLIRRSYHRAHVPLADWSLFEAAFDSLAPNNSLRFYLAYVEDVPVAASAELFYKDTVYGWYSGTERTYSKYIPGEMLMWHVLNWSASNGYRIYDFGGAGRPGEAYGVRDFKAKFGGQLVEYGRFTITHAPIRVGLSKLGYFIYQRLPWIWADQRYRDNERQAERSAGLE